MKTIKTVMNGDVNDCGVFYKKAVVCWVCANFLIHLLHRFLSKCWFLYSSFLLLCRSVLNRRGISSNLHNNSRLRCCIFCSCVKAVCENSSWKYYTNCKKHEKHGEFVLKEYSNLHWIVLLKPFHRCFNHTCFLSVWNMCLVSELGLKEKMDFSFISVHSVEKLTLDVF